MKKRILSILTVLLIATMMTSTVSAGGNVKFSGGANSVEWTLGSLDAKGALILGNTDVIVVLEASGRPDVTCTNQGSNPAPGQNPPKLGATGSQDLPGENETKNGKTPFDVKAIPPPTLPGSQGGCPNDNWIAHVDFVSWEDAKITVKSLALDTILLVQNYTCTTTRYPAPTVSCTPK
jgi:hypothetical protein